jgi:hypothetical protein
MELYRVTVDVIKPEEVENWAGLYVAEADTLSYAAENNSTMQFSNYEVVSPTQVNIELYFKTKEDYEQYKIFRETIPEYQQRTAYEQENGITRTVVSEDIVNR